jgi:hypothetical protein
MSQAPLKPLHESGSLSQAKLRMFRRLSTRALIESLRPGMPGSLKTRPDGTILDGHHRIEVLGERNTDVEALPREIIPKEKPGWSGEP